jgi:hypothetical protein
MILLFYFIVQVFSDEPCVYPSFYWRDNNAFSKSEDDWPLIEKNQFVKTENFTICQITWLDLYNLDISLIQEKNILWLLLFQSYCTSTLNYAKITDFLEGLTPEQKAFYDDKVFEMLDRELLLLNENMIKSFNLLDRNCEKMSDLNFFESKLMTISLIKNLSRINSGSIIGYCNDDVKKFENINLKIYTLFQNTSYHDLSEFNISNLLYLKPLYYDTNITQSQFIMNDWVINIEINKKTALTLFLLIISLVFIGIFQIWYFYGNCCRIKNRLSLANKSDEEEKFVGNNESPCGRRCCTIFFRCCNALFKKKKVKIEDYGNEGDDDGNIIKLEDFQKID